MRPDRKIPWYRSIRLKLVAGALIVEVLVLALLLANSYRLASDALESQTRARLGMLASLLDASLAERVFQRDHSEIATIIRQLVGSKLTEIRYIIVLDRRGEVMASAGELTPQMQSPGASEDRSVGAALADLTYDTSLPLTFQGNRIGSARFGLSLADLASLRGNVLQQSLLIALGSLLLSLLLLLIGSYLVTRHLAGLVAATRRIASADYSTPIALARQDEIGLLADNFNEMAATVQSRIRLLAESETRFRSIFDAAGDAIFIHDAESGRLLDVNRRMCEMYGCTYEQALNATLADFSANVAPYTLLQAAEKLRLAREDGPQTFDWRAQRWEGPQFWVEVGLRRARIGTDDRIIALVRDITGRKQQEQHMRKLLAENETILNNALVGIAYLKRRHIASCNRRLEEIFQYEPGELIGESSERLYDSRATFEAIGNDAYQTVSENKSYNTELRLRHKDGSVFWGALSGRAIDPAHPHEGSIWIYSDITDRKQAEFDLRIAASAFESQEGMMVTDVNGVILRINRAFTQSTGYSSEEAVGQTPRLLKSGRHDAEFFCAMWETIQRTGGWQGEIWDRRKNGEVYPKWLTISAVKDDEGKISHYIGAHYDITERKKAEQKIEELAFFDQLTGLPNRTLLLDRLKQAMTASHRSETCGAVLFIDLDHFKTLNDSLGHDKGDLLLQQVAQRLAACVREGDTVARLGGDEFVVVLESLNGIPQEAANQTESVGEKILAALQQTYLLGDVEHRSTASIGATLFYGHETSIDDLLKQADLAMYKAKDTGRNALSFFDPAMQTIVMERVALEADLREAVHKKQFVLHYQAQVVDEGRVIGAEVLVRWQHPERGMVSPAEFIPLAEETGLILPLGDWVLETACRQLALWASRAEMAHLTVAVNVSAQQFREADFVDSVLAVLRQTGANPQRLKLELTESLLVSNVEDIVGKMHALKAKGVGFSLDDFGTGYSSLSYLRRLPLDQLKIDQSFVRDVLSDPNDAVIAKTIVALAQSLGLGVIAEGVETTAQRDFLANSGCHAYQGYFFSRPLPIAGFEQFVQRV
jgi:diguanylate cyclase (GGDEF)-like protein/PAS domain S-box-containing protein